MQEGSSKAAEALLQIAHLGDASWFDYRDEVKVHFQQAA